MTTSEERERTFAELRLRCEVCKGTATAMVQDFVRISSTSLFVRFERDGEAHLFCEVHNRKPRVRNVFCDPE